MKNFRLIIPVVLLVLLASSCNRKEDEFSCMPTPKETPFSHEACARPLKIAILSDLHYMNPSLLEADGSAFQMYLMQDPKLLAESKAITSEIFHNLLEEKPDLVLISGDLTKDGELVSHKALIRQLKQLTEAHIRIVVAPGNHDIGNPDAKLFNGDIAEPVPSITPEEFSQLYSDFGYRTAISKDAASLSYVSQPFRNLRILVLDANEYYNNTPNYCVVAGHIKDETLDWAKLQLAEAQAKGITVIGMMHHGIIEHFMGESVIFADYLVDDWNQKAQELMNAGLKIIFTGHFHANDATEIQSGEMKLTDVETGSPVIWNSPYRIALLDQNVLSLETRHVRHINYPLPKGISFTEYEKEFSINGITLQAGYMLTNPPYNVPAELAEQIAPVFAGAMMAHLAGDEVVTPETAASLQAVYDVSNDLGNILYGLYTDLPPSDNKLVVDLN
jgi:3',5'-cyclic AMP phosphodiesterase CpdA